MASGPGSDLTDGDCLAHLFLGHPAALADQLPLHLSDECNRPAKAEQAEAEKVGHDLAEAAMWIFCGRPIICPHLD